MNAAQKSMQDLLDARVESVATDLGINPFWLEPGTLVIIFIIIGLILGAVYLAITIPRRH